MATYTSRQMQEITTAVALAVKDAIENYKAPEFAENDPFAEFYNREDGLKIAALDASCAAVRECRLKFGMSEFSDHDDFV